MQYKSNAQATLSPVGDTLSPNVITPAIAWAENKRLRELLEANGIDYSAVRIVLEVSSTPTNGKTPGINS